MYIELFLITIMVITMGVLNRLRGTGLIKYFGTIILPYVYKTPIKISLVWNHIYGLYIGLVVGLFSLSIWYGIVAFILYIIGESKGWGEWIGTLSRSEPTTEAMLITNYNDNEGKKFPFIHQIANFFIKEQTIGTFKHRSNQYMRYASLALSLRGVWWWLPLYILLAYIDLISYPEAFIGVLIISIMFPINCLLSRYIGFNRKFWVVQFGRGWENQEFLNGITHGIVLWMLLLDIKLF